MKPYVQARGENSEHLSFALKADPAPFFAPNASALAVLSVNVPKGAKIAVFVTSAGHYRVKMGATATDPGSLVQAAATPGGDAAASNDAWMLSPAQLDVEGVSQLMVKPLQACDVMVAFYS